MMIQNTYIRSLQYVSTLFFIILYGVLFTACIREKPPIDEELKNRLGDGEETRFAPGTADNIYNIDKFFKVIDQIPSDTLDDSLLQQGGTIKIRTSKEGKEVKISTSEEGVLIDPNVSFLNKFYVLKYNVLETETFNQKELAELLGEVPEFKGFPNTVYDIVPYLQGNYLILYRLSDPEKVPYDEMPISLTVGNKVATPLVRYPIRYCEEQVILNSDNEETKLYRPKCENVSKDSATYVELIKKGRKEFFKYVPSKVDIFPRDFFEGEWFFSPSIVRAFRDQGTGNQVGHHKGFKNVDIVAFQKTAESLRMIDATNYKRVEAKENKGKEATEKKVKAGTNEIVSFSIPVEWKEYEMNPDVNVFAEQENERTNNVDRPYFKIKFKELAKNVAEEGESVKVENVFITNDYFSFTISKTGDSGDSKWIKYAFKKKVEEGQKYVEKQWFQKDSTDFFPIFLVTRTYFPKASDHNEEDRGRFLRVTRFNPHSPDSSSTTTTIIKWYFSKQTPQDDWVRNFGRKAVEYWNKAFQEAGKGSNYKIKIVLDESEDKELGDIRYNILNLMMSDVQGGRLFGLGPSVSDPITGEILSATSNVWVRNSIDTYVMALRDYIRFNAYPPAWKLLPESPGVTDFLHEKIKNECPEVGQFIKMEKQKGKWHPTESSLDDKEIIEKCSRKLAESHILSVTVHEMGHCFGLQHVFSASADTENYYKNYKEIKRIYDTDEFIEATEESYPYHPPKFSSVMDYGHPYFPQLSVPGKYDIAAIRFVYFDKVEQAGGSLLDVPAGVDEEDKEKSQKSISDVVSKRSVEVKKYKVCQSNNQDDPLCSQDDYGSTPLEVVENYIRLSQDSLMQNRRYDSVGLSLKIFDNFVRVQRFAKLLSGFYKKWLGLRDDLLTGLSDSINDYAFFEGRSMDQYKELISTHVEHNSEFAAYNEVRQKIFDYYEKILFLPPKHCIYKKNNSTYQAVPLETIIEKIKPYSLDDAKTIILTDCQSPIIEEWAKREDIGEFITEVGYFVDHRQYFIKPNEKNEIDEYSPFVPFNFTFMLLYKGEQSRVVLERYQKFDKQLPKGGLYPSVIDELEKVIFQDPVFLTDIVQKVENYLIGEGRDFNPYINRDDVILPRFLSYDIDNPPVVPIAAASTITENNGTTNIDVKGLPTNNILHMMFVWHNSIFRRRLTSEKHQKLIAQKKRVVPTSREALYNLVTNTIDLSKPESQTLHPFLYDVYQQYQQKKSGQSDGQYFVDFLLNHSSLCKGEQKVLYSFYMGGFIDQICQRFNEYQQCIHEKASCENKEDKEAFVKYFRL